MSKDKNNQPLPEAPEPASEIDKKIATLRQRLTIHTTAWPPFANALFADLSVLADETEDDAMLISLVEDALRGVDIPRKHPEAYHRLLANGRLRQTFLDLLTALDPNEPSAMPSLPKPDLSFLYKASPPQPAIRQTPAGWKAAWQLVGDYLNHCLSAPISPAYRSTYDDLLDEQSITLLEGEFSIAGSEWDILLEANLSTENPETPILLLSVATKKRLTAPPLQAAINWGSYQATAVLDSYGQATFPPVDFSTLLDESGHSFNADLSLTLETQTTTAP